MLEISASLALGMKYLVPGDLGKLGSLPTAAGVSESIDLKNHSECVTNSG